MASPATTLAGKTVLVTGAARRIGRVIALAFAREGADIAIHYRNSAREANVLGQQIGEMGCRVVTMAADLTVPQQARALVDQTIAQLGRLDVLVNNAAVFSRCELRDPDEDRWERAWQQSLQTNLLAPARLARYAAAELEVRRGTIINIVDVAGSLAWPGYAHHSAAKAGLTSLTQTLAAELAPQVRVTGVSPGIALFPADLSAERQQHFVDKTALRRAGSPEDIAAAVVWLARQSYITGTVLPVDGGWSLNICR